MKMLFLWVAVATLVNLTQTVMHLKLKIKLNLILYGEASLRNAYLKLSPPTDIKLRKF